MATSLWERLFDEANTLEAVPLPERDTPKIRSLLRQVNNLVGTPDSTAAGDSLVRVDGLPIKPGSGALPYFDASIADKVTGFFRVLADEGVPVQMTDGFRTNRIQSTVVGNEYGGAPVGSSLHEAGYSFDVNWTDLTNAQKTSVLDTARRSGFRWGGNFRKTDPVHFFIDPFSGPEARRAYVPAAQRQYEKLKREGQ